MFFSQILDLNYKNTFLRILIKLYPTVAMLSYRYFHKGFGIIGEITLSANKLLNYDRHAGGEIN